MALLFKIAYIAAFKAFFGKNSNKKVAIAKMQQPPS
jgi:hypothetical protein